MKGTISFDTDEDRIGFKRNFTCNCDHCGRLTEYNEKHDAWYCPVCDEWAEVKCSDPECRFCAGRPDKPSEVK